ncbi:MAG: T9SS type A sorting domain-containing protein [Bacteroidales bacterium]|nr:T9SS type A sorting domain-containing protein [Bacteroidales bacterium]
MNTITIPEDYTLTIESTVSMGPDAKINVERGAKLILDGGTLTNYKFCEYENDLWQGVEVWGDDSESQYPCQGNLEQGTIEIKNGGTIENAVRGVLLSKYDGVDYDEDYNGGIIRVLNGGNPLSPDANFINNQRSVVFRVYENFTVNQTTCAEGAITSNLSSLSNCHFEVNGDYLGGSFMSYVYMFAVRGISIRGCTFINDYSINPSGHGINAWGAGFKVEAICNSQQSPCPPQDLDKCTFTNFAKAVNNNSSGTKTVAVTDAIFTDNTRGVALNNVHNASVLFSQFNIGKTQQQEEEACEGEGEGKLAAAYGIDMEACTGFSIEENTFAPGGTGGEYVGIRCKDSETEYDIIYKNTFNGVDYGNFAEGNNRSESDDLFGLEFQCNTNTGNEVDFIVAQDLDDPLENPQIRTFQGTLTLEAGNIFSTGAQVGTEGHFKNEGTQVVNYFYNTNPPVYYTPDYVVPVDVTGQNTCPSNYGGGSGGDPKGLVLTPGQKTQTELDYATNLSDYNNLKALYDNLKDGGNTEALQDEIEMSWPQDMWELRAELLGKSPHLSKEVLMTMADKTDVMPESVIFEILSANPDELRKEELISYLENKEQPLPGYMISILKQLAGGITYKTILLQNMASYNAAKTTAAYDLIRSSLNETETDFQYLRNWFDNLDNMNADMQIVETYLAENDYTSAQSMLDMIPSLYELQGSDLEEYNDLKGFTEMQMNWMQEGRNIFDLSDMEIAALVDYADNSMGKVSAMAKGILEFADGHYYCNCLPIGNGISSKSASVQPILKEQDHGLLIEATPNPAKTWVAFDYTLPVYANDAVLQVTDMKGKSVTQFILNSKQGQQLWDVRDVEKGVYLYTLTVGGNSKSGKLIIE